MINSLLTLTFLFSLLLSGLTQARTFSNSDGKSIEAELISVEGELAVMKLTNSRTIKVAIKKFSTADQNYINTWWQENKNLITERDVRLSIQRKNYYTKKPTTVVSGGSSKGKGGNSGKIKTSESEFTFICELDNYSAKTINGITASYSIYKRSSKRDKKSGSSNEVEIITDSILLDPLEARKHVKFTTEGVLCNDMSDTKLGKSQRETVFGMVLTLSVDGNEIITRSHPENFIRQLKEQEAREERIGKSNNRREEQKDIADGKREDSGDRKYKEEVAREKRIREAKEAVANRKAKEEEARHKNKNRFKNR